MANKKLFSSVSGKRNVKKVVADTRNAAGGKAYSNSPEHRLAQMALTGCIGQTFYVSAKDQLDTILDLCKIIEDKSFILKLAVYARENGFMKDVPALLLAYLHNEYVIPQRVFDRVINNYKMLANFCQIIRSGRVGRKSFGRSGKRLVANWLNGRTVKNLFDGSTGVTPAIQDVIKMIHPKPIDKAHDAFYAYCLGKSFDARSLPQEIRQFEGFKRGAVESVPAVPFQRLISLNNLEENHWKSIAKNANWHTTRMNLNTFDRHGVFDDDECVQVIAERLKDADTIRKVRVFPYQLLAAYKAAGSSAPRRVVDALHDAVDTATENVPTLKGKGYVLVDVSASMGWEVTGRGHGRSSAMSCMDAAGMFASAIMRKNPDCEVLLFDTATHKTRLNHRDTVFTNTEKMANHCGGGTDCSAPMRDLNDEKAKADWIIYVSDNQSWFGNTNYWYNRETTTKDEWNKFKKRNKNCKLYCIDITPNNTTQLPEELPDVYNIGGFSDNVFKMIDLIQTGKVSGMVDEVSKVAV